MNVLKRAREHLEFLIKHFCGVHFLKWPPFFYIIVGKSETKSTHKKNLKNFTKKEMKTFEQKKREKITTRSYKSEKEYREWRKSISS